MRRHRRLAVLLASVFAVGVLLVPSAAPASHSALRDAARARAISRVQGNNGPSAGVTAHQCGTISARLQRLVNRLRQLGLHGHANRVQAITVRFCASP